MKPAAAAEAPLVIAYLLALGLLVFGWSNVKPPAMSILELHAMQAGVAMLQVGAHR